MKTSRGKLMNLQIHQKVTRIGVYGVAIENAKILVVKQKRGPYAGRFDFPGGGIEYGEAPEQALRREFAEEVDMEFDTLELIDNLSAVVDVLGSASVSNEPYSLYQIGMLYRVNGCRLLGGEAHGELQCAWVNLLALTKEECSELLWQYRSRWS
jgi:8-oxo-dGTP pyrophosphatase MutT (NUDIX family)